MIVLLALLAGLTGTTPDPVLVTGRVVRVVDGDTLAVGGASVVLHGVGPERQGPLDSLPSSATGAFRFRVTPDSGTILLVSARWAGIEYFAPPLSGSSDVTVVVVDTASTQAVELAARHLIIAGPAPDGARDVVDLFILANRGDRTRVAPDSLTATWRMPLPPHIANVTVGDADFSPEAFDVHGDTRLLHAAIPPGERQFFLSYQLAPGARTLDVPLGPRPDTMSILTEERDLRITGGPQPVGEEEVAGRVFQRSTGGGERLAARVVVTLAGRTAAPGWTLYLLLGGLLVGLALATRRALLPRRS